MITLSAEAQDVIGRSFRYYLAVDSWRSGVLLAADVPVSDAVEETDRSLNVPERVTFTVPRVVGGVSWSPVGDDSPLAANGQQLRVKLGIGVARGNVEWFQRGVFLIHDCTVDGDRVDVAAVGLLQYIDEARLVSPFVPTGTMASTLRALIEPALTVDIDAGLVDRAVPSTINYDEARLGAVNELLDAWAATAVVDPYGVLQVVPSAQSHTPVLALTDQAGGTVITATGSSTREGAVNVVVARGQAADGGQLQGVAYDTSGGPKTFGGPFSPLPVPRFFFSPLLTDQAQCNAAAATILAKQRLRAGREFTVDMVPNPAIQCGDVVSITTRDHGALTCSVEALRLPYTAQGGNMRLTVRMV